MNVWVPTIFVTGIANNLMRMVYVNLFWEMCVCVCKFCLLETVGYMDSLILHFKGVIEDIGRP